MLCLLVVAVLVEQEVPQSNERQILAKKNYT